MGNITGNPTWEENIYQYETTDLVLGGPDGIANTPAKQLANRTKFLDEQRKKGLAGITAIGAGTFTLSKTQCEDKLIEVNAAGGNVVLTLPTLAVEDAGFNVRLFCFGVTANQVVLNKSGDGLVLVPDVKDVLYFGNGDSATLIWNGGSWLVLDFKGNFDKVGKTEFDYTQRANTVIANGQLLNRVQYPRLWDFLQAIPSLVVTDFVWQSTPGYKGFFSSGNGTTTFRVPDLRSMFIRGLDLGAGISFGRNTSLPGGYEGDAIIDHIHRTTFTNNSNSQSGAGKVTVGGDGPEGTPPSYDSTGARALNGTPIGASETRPKNIGLIPLILV